MIIAAHSNLISGLYFIVFETFVPLVLGFSLQKLISAQNLHTLHNRRQTLHLTKTRFSLGGNYGITTAKYARLASILGSLILILTIIGSFSIDGRSRGATTFKNAQYFITAATNEDEMINFAQHISPNGSLVSATYLLTREGANCRIQNVGTRIMFSAVASFDGDINSISHKRSSFPPNISCMYARNGFVNGATFVEEHTSQDRRFGRDCQYLNEFSELVTNRSSLLGIMNVRNGTIWEGRAEIRCAEGDVEVTNTWCASFVNFLCVSQVRLDGKFFFLYQVFDSAIVHPTSVLVAPRYTERPELTRTMQSTAYLMANSLRIDLAGSVGLARMSITRNISVEMDAGEVLETEVLVWLFLSTAGVATAITLSVCMLATMRWRKYVVWQDLKGRNSVSAAIDVMKLAAAIAHDERGEAEAGAAMTDDVVVGVGAGERVGPVAATEIGRSEFEEHGVDGRCRQRKRKNVLALHQWGVAK